MSKYYPNSAPNVSRLARVKLRQVGAKQEQQPATVSSLNSNTFRMGVLAGMTIQKDEFPKQKEYFNLNIVCHACSEGNTKKSQIDFSINVVDIDNSGSFNSNNNLQIINKSIINGKPLTSEDISHSNTEGIITVYFTSINPGASSITIPAEIFTKINQETKETIYNRAETLTWNYQVDAPYPRLESKTMYFKFKDNIDAAASGQGWDTVLTNVPDINFIIQGTPTVDNVNYFDNLGGTVENVNPGFKFNTTVDANNPSFTKKLSLVLKPNQYQDYMGNWNVRREENWTFDNVRPKLENIYLKIADNNKRKVIKDVSDVSLVHGDCVIADNNNILYLNPRDNIECKLIFSKPVRMGFGTDVCLNVVFNNEDYVKFDNVQLKESIGIKEPSKYFTLDPTSANENLSISKVQLSHQNILTDNVNAYLLPDFLTPGNYIVTGGDDNKDISFTTSKTKFLYDGDNSYSIKCSDQQPYITKASFKKASYASMDTSYNLNPSSANLHKSLSLKLSFSENIRFLGNTNPRIRLSLSGGELRTDPSNLSILTTTGFKGLSAEFWTDNFSLENITNSATPVTALDISFIELIDYSSNIQNIYGNYINISGDNYMRGTSTNNNYTSYEPTTITISYDVLPKLKTVKLLNHENNEFTRYNLAKNGGIQNHDISLQLTFSEDIQTVTNMSAGFKINLSNENLAITKGDVSNLSFETTGLSNIITIGGCKIENIGIVNEHGQVQERLKIDNIEVIYKDNIVDSFGNTFVTDANNIISNFSLESTIEVFNDNVKPYLENIKLLDGNNEFTKYNVGINNKNNFDVSFVLTFSENIKVITSPNIQVNLTNDNLSFEHKNNGGEWNTDIPVPTTTNAVPTITISGCRIISKNNDPFGNDAIRGEVTVDNITISEPNYLTDVYSNDISGSEQGNEFVIDYSPNPLKFSTIDFYYENISPALENVKLFQGLANSAGDLTYNMAKNGVNHFDLSLQLVFSENIRVLEKNTMIKIGLVNENIKIKRNDSENIILELSGLHDNIIIRDCKIENVSPLLSNYNILEISYITLNPSSRIVDNFSNEIILNDRDNIKLPNELRVSDKFNDSQVITLIYDNVRPYLKNISTKLDTAEWWGTYEYPIEYSGKPYINFNLEFNENIRAVNNNDDADFYNFNDASYIINFKNSKIVTNPLPLRRDNTSSQSVTSIKNIDLSICKLDNIVVVARHTAVIDNITIRVKKDYTIKDMCNNVIMGVSGEGTDANTTDWTISYEDLYNFKNKINNSQTIVIKPP